MWPSTRHGARLFSALQHQTSSICTTFTHQTLARSAASSRAYTAPTSPRLDAKAPETTQDALSAKRKSPKRATGAKKGLRDPFRRVVSIAQTPERNNASASSRSPTSRSRSQSQDGSSSFTVVDENNGDNTISAVCVADSFDMDKARTILETHGFRIDPDMTDFDLSDVLHARGEGKGDIFVFPSGTVVTWSLAPEMSSRLATGLLLSAAEMPHLDRVEVEALEFVEDARAETSLMRGDVVVLGTRRRDLDNPQNNGEATSSTETEPPPLSDDDDNNNITNPTLDQTLAKIAFSAGLARSTKIAYLETSLVTYFFSTRLIPTTLARGHLPPSCSRSYIIRTTGQLLSLRAQLNHFSELTDSLPDLFWDQKPELRLENYYDLVGRALDVNDRIRTLNQKMDYAQEISAVLREMATERHSTRLEWIIIVLIAVEVAFELRRVFMELREPERTLEGARH